MQTKRTFDDAILQKNIFLPNQARRRNPAASEIFTMMLNLLEKILASGLSLDCATLIAGRIFAGLENFYNVLNALKLSQSPFECALRDFDVIFEISLFEIGMPLGSALSSRVFT